MRQKKAAVEQPIQQNIQELEQEFTEHKITDEQLSTSNEPTFINALESINTAPEKIIWPDEATKKAVLALADKSSILKTLIGILDAPDVYDIEFVVNPQAVRVAYLKNVPNATEEELALVGGFRSSGKVVMANLDIRAVGEELFHEYQIGIIYKGEKISTTDIEAEAKVVTKLMNYQESNADKGGNNNLDDLLEYTGEAILYGFSMEELGLGMLLMNAVDEGSLMINSEMQLKEYQNYVEEFKNVHSAKDDVYNGDTSLKEPKAYNQLLQETKGAENKKEKTDGKD